MKKTLRIGFASTAILVTALALGVMAEQLEIIGEAEAVATGQTRARGATVEYTPVGATGLTVSFGSGSFPPAGSVSATIVVDKDVTDSWFGGNMIERGINTLQFKIHGDGLAPSLALVSLNYRSETRRTWSIPFDVSRTPGEVVTIILPLTIAAGWSADYHGNQYAMLAQDLQDVESVSVRVSPGDPDDTGSLDPQSYTVTDFVAINDDGISSQPGVLSPDEEALEQALISNFSYGYGSVDALTDEMKEWDQDLDGMADYVEIMSEHDEDYADSIFAAEDIVTANDGIELTWVCVEGQTYSVLRSESIQGTFSVVPELEGLVASGTGYMTGKDGSDEVVNGEGPFFYRIRKD